ncbi:MAG: aldo/keto reductase [Thermoleophilia bacterium]|nr:aldo/keto reductase [Thermoleophilia bacterium]
MLCRPLGRTGEQVSVLGFGCMRLPVIDGRRDFIDVPRATEMLYYALDQGVNYVDTAWAYHGASFDAPGNSEVFLGDALAGGYRDKVLVATKLPPSQVKAREDMDAILAGQLERLRTDYIDCYLLHGLDANMWARMVELGALEFLDTAKADGRIRYAGFSFHDDLSVFTPIVDAYDWDFCQIQYNYMDTEFQAGAAGLAYAAERGLGIVVMEPLKGGRLSAPVPAPIQGLLDAAPDKRSATEWALRFIWDDPRVSVVLSGMSTMEQVVENVDIASRAEPGSLGPGGVTLIEQLREAFRARTPVDCTGCRYCLPCPEGITIPMVLGFVNDAALFDALEAEQGGYDIMVMLGQTAPASACVECGQCEEACPQHLEIIKEMAGASRLFDHPAPQSE